MIELKGGFNLVLNSKMNNFLCFCFSLKLIKIKEDVGELKKETNVLTKKEDHVFIDLYTFIYIYLFLAYENIIIKSSITILTTYNETDQIIIFKNTPSKNAFNEEKIFKKLCIPESFDTNIYTQFF